MALEAGLFPTAATVAAWIDAALDRETAFKCTAGLHHAVRHRDHETGFEHHGFLNVLLATRLAFDGGTPAEVARVLDDHYANDLVALARQADLAGARRWFTSYGSCSVTEPLDDLVGLGLLAAPVVSTGSTDGKSGSTDGRAGSADEQAGSTDGGRGECVRLRARPPPLRRLLDRGHGAPRRRPATATRSSTPPA